MNERIRELSKQADEYAEKNVHYYMGQFDGLTWEDKIKQTRDTKFAQLIVRECALQCQHNDDMDRIEKHFGVEE